MCVCAIFIQGVGRTGASPIFIAKAVYTYKQITHTHTHTH